MKRYFYYISYAHGGDDAFGFGAIEMFLYRAIDSFDEIAAIQKKITEKDPTAKNPLVINFILLRIEE